jgi:quercetin dioxygenase-like cupin family protein
MFTLGLGGCATHHAGPGAGGPARSKATTVLTHALPADVGREGRVITVEYLPGESTPAHEHDGVIFAYVAQGAVVTALDDGSEQRFEAGQAWYENPGQVHRVSRNASATAPAKLVVFYLTEPGKPVLQMRK